MPRTIFTPPPSASWPIWKSVLLVLGFSVLWISLIWIFRLPLVIYRNDSPGLKTSDILLGIVWLPYLLWMRWTWKPGRKHRRWHHWIANLFASLYITLLLLCGGISYWNALLGKPWNLLVNTVSIVLFMLMWVLPALSYTVAKRLVNIQRSFDLKLLKFGGPAALMIMAGILGANFGMHGSLDGRMLFMAFLFPVLSLGLAQYFATSLWPYRPWQKEAE